MTNLAENDLVNEGALPPDDFHDNIERVVEVSEYELQFPVNLMERLEQETSHLLIDRNVLVASAAALNIGHLVLQGPPGTGKSSLARALCRSFHCSILQATANENWTTYDVIGRQTLTVDNQGNEQVIPVNGFFTEAVIRCAGAIVKHFDDTNEPQANWLFIDELNRAHIDRAFGELFTLIGTDEIVPITLSHQIPGNQELVVPKRFRLIATINTVDRQFVNSLSQGLKRRFNFVTVDIPPHRLHGEVWGSDNPSASLAIKEFLIVVNRASERFVASRRLSNEIVSKEDVINLLLSRGMDELIMLFDFVEKVRYTKRDQAKPFLPIGTALLIDIVELFLSRIYLEGVSTAKFANTMDWAIAIKLAPLFDTDTISLSNLEDFAESLSHPFNQLLRHELMQIVSAGQFYVK